jgi:uncharacterized protein (TIGR03437 family)
LAIEPDGRVLLGGSAYFPDVPISPGVVFSEAAADRTSQGTFMAAFDLSLTITGPQLGCVVDSATMVPVGPLAPGQLISFFGAGFDSGTVLVTFDGIAAPLLFVGPSQINAQVPFATSQDRLTVMSVSVGSITVSTRMFAGTPINPSVFVDGPVSPAAACAALPDGTPAYHAVALNADGSTNSCDNPATAASTITIFLNGVPAPQTGSVSVRSDGLSLAAGPLMQAAPGVEQLPVQLPEPKGLRGIALAVDVAGMPAAPFGPALDTSVLVWVK